MKLTSEQQQLVLDNRKLVYYLVQNLGITQNSSEYEDIVSIGTIGLIKAIMNFDTSRNVAFATYASRCIHNEIFMYFRKQKKYAKQISTDEPILDTKKSNELKLGDTIQDPNSDFVENIVDKEEFIHLINIILNCLSAKHKLVLLYWIGNTIQKEIAKKLNISQSYVSRLLAEAIKQIKEVANNQHLHYMEVFFMSLVGNEYRISFSSKDIRDFNKIFSTLLQNLTSIENLPDFKVSCNRERIVIQLPAMLESFSFIAQIVQEIDEFSMSFVSNNHMSSVDDASTPTVEIDDTNPEAVTSFEEQTSEEIPTTPTEKAIVDETISSDAVGKESMAKQVRDYMLAMDYFTVKDLKNHFPNFATTNIRNVVSVAKSKGLISAISRGKYVVRKT